MRTQTILALALFLAVRAGSQDAPKVPVQAQCKFSDGTTIAVAYSNERKSYLFTTDGSLVTIRGIRVASGDYAVSLTNDGDNKWALRMKKQILKSGDRVLPPLPMSVATRSFPAEIPVAFDQTGGSCMMYWRRKSSVLSLEFTRENTDMPVSE
jgi:hypothetical protein